MIQEYAMLSLEMPENDKKKNLSQDMNYEIENTDINDEFTIKL